MDARNMPLLGVAIPCFNESETVELCADVVSAVLGNLVAAGKISADSFVVFVDDGSSDKTWEKIVLLSQRLPVRGIKLAANVGHQRALLAGLDYCATYTDACISMDADLQDDVAAIATMIDAYRDGADVVFGVRTDRHADGWWKRNTAQAFYRLLSAMGVKTVPNHADFRLMSARALTALGEFHERNIYLRGLCASLGFATAEVGYCRKVRVAGESKYPLGKMLGLAWDGVTSFSVMPLRLISFLGVMVFVGTLLATAWVLYAKFIRLSTMPGWTSTVLPIFFLGGVQLLSLGVLGEYLAKVYIETKGRPRYIIEEEIDASERK
ncbi:MAG: glycosyltransferase family 2 protein [Alcanivorax sp.]|nr:glycosyltransferase family 2 protein [Alcanivorax sp.]